MKHSKKIPLIFLSLLATNTQEAYSTGIPVADAASVAQEIIVVAQTLQSNLNEVSSLANQATQISNDIKNLTSMSPAILNQYLGQYAGVLQQLQSTYSSINGLASDINNLTTNYKNLFPDVTSGNITPQGIAQQLTGWLAQAKQTYQGVYRMSGQVMDSIPMTNSQIAAISQASNGASGNLDAVQAQTQMTAQLATQITQMNAQMAGFYQAQADSLSQQAQMLANSQATAQKAASNFALPSTAVAKTTWNSIQ